MKPDLTSRAVRWWEFHKWCQEWLSSRNVEADSWPMCGTQAWFDLDNRDVRKWAAVLEASEHHVLRVEHSQVALAEASKAISGAADWSAIANETRNLAEFRRERPWARRSTQRGAA
jgi:hypothetical protein